MTPGAEVLADRAEEIGEKGITEVLRTGCVWVSTAGGQVFATRAAALAWGQHEADRLWARERVRVFDERSSVLRWASMESRRVIEIILTKVAGL